jgi:hypothetical protein
MGALALAGCTSSPEPDSRPFFKRTAVSEKEARLDNTAMAFFVGPQSDEMFTEAGEVHEPGYVVLVNADGSFRAVETKRMDKMRLAWSEQGIEFADESSDYRLTASGLTRSENPKPLAQNLMFALPAGGSIGVYNGGIGPDGGYINNVAFTVAGQTDSSKIEGNYFTGALCDGQVFGLTNMPGAHASAAPKAPDMVSQSNTTATPQMLARLYPAEGGEKVIAWRPNLGSGTPSGPVPCHDGVITFLSWDIDAAGKEQPNIVSWNTVNGRHQEFPLTFDDATSLNLEDFGYVVQDWQEGRLHWVYADGRVFSTDAATGKTATLFKTGLGTGPGRPTKSLYAFSDSQLHVLNTTPGGEGNIEYSVFNRADGATIRKVSVPIPNLEVNISYRNLSDMVVPAKP